MANAGCSAQATSAVLVFFGYAVVQHRPTLYVLYRIDNLIFFGGIALTTCLRKIAPEADLKPALSMGVTMNHIAAVFAPLIGGVAWYFLGYQVIFFSGSLISLISLIVSQKVNPEGMACSLLLCQDKKEDHSVGKWKAG